MIDHEDHTVSIRAEQAVLGSLLLDNDAVDRCADLDASHFWREDHRLIFGELQRQIGAGQRADAMTLYAALGDRVEDCLKYLANLRMSAASSANIARHAEIVRDKAQKRALVTIGMEAQELGASFEESASCVDLIASKLEMLSQRKTKFEPRLIGDMLSDYLDAITRRVSGLDKPVPTGHKWLDEALGGGLEKGTVTTVAGRPGMGKTALGLGIGRNAAEAGFKAAILSMEMAGVQLNDRNVAAMGKIPLAWLRNPGESANDTVYWDRLSYTVNKLQEMPLWIDEQAGMNMVELRAKLRKIKRKSGVDIVIIDQLSFITGGDGDADWQRIGQYTRGLIDIAKSLDIAIVLLAQLNRECEKRTDKRPMLSDLAQSGSIEQDSANVIFLYRDVIYNKDTQEPETAEIIIAKQRQGQPCTVGMRYNGMYTVFEDFEYRWERKVAEKEPSQRMKGRGFGA